MQRFRGSSEHTLDSKGRLIVPARFRDVLREVYTEELVVTNWKHCLRAYPLSEWELLEEKLMDPQRQRANFGDIIRGLISGMVECPLDRQGRILLPQKMREEYNIQRDVVLVGMLKHFEIWEKALWDVESRKFRENFASFEENLADLGLF